MSSDSTHLAPPPQFSQFNITKYVWRKIKEFLLRRKYFRACAAERIDLLQACKEQADTAFGIANGISNLIGSQINLQRWRMMVGKDILKILPLPRPTRRDFLETIKREYGVDLLENVRITDDAVAFGKVQISLPRNRKENVFSGDLWDVAFYDYLQQHYAPYSFIVEANFDEGPYEYENVSLQEGDIVFDCGANIGTFSAVASRRGCSVFAFEAAKDTIENHLSKTAEMNGNIRICNFAVWDKEETLEFVFMSNLIGSSRCDQLLTWKQSLRKDCRHVSVPAITLDAFVERNGIERVDFIKSDIEGAERNMLRGATRILREFAPKLALCTYHLPDDSEVMRDIVLSANPRYKIVERYRKMFAYVP